MNTGVEYLFVCPVCEETIDVNSSMKDALVENGCVICGSSVSQAAFSERDDSDET